jgi:hypothetical protein
MSSTTHSGLVSQIHESKLLRQWHWFQYHFTFLTNGIADPFATSIVDACLAVDERVPGFAINFMASLAEIGGVDRDRGHFAQLLQRLSELLVIRQATTFTWPCAAHFQYEPTAAGSKKNPELTVDCGEELVGIEVKAPSLLDHAERRGTNPLQLPARGPARETSIVKTADGVTLPRDYPMRDFLLSADDKFRAFKAAHKNFYGVLVVVWDDHIYEPISSLLSDSSGLFTEKSWAKDGLGHPLRYSSVDAVIVVRHLHEFIRASQHAPSLDGKRHALDYGRDGEYPFKALVTNPHGRGFIPQAVIACFQAYTPSPEMGAEYVPSDLVMWSNPDVNK